VQNNKKARACAENLYLSFLHDFCKTYPSHKSLIIIRIGSMSKIMFTSFIGVFFC
jgi:hypothetical protein